MDGFEDFLNERGVSLSEFYNLADHEKIQMLNRFLTRGVPQRSIKAGDWKNVINSVLQVKPEDHDPENVYQLIESSSWDVVELPATVSGPSVDGYGKTNPISHIHGQEHGAEAEYVTMGVVVARHLEDYPGSLFVNVFQDWVGYSHCFCSIELQETDEGDYRFVRGTFHPGSAGLIDEQETEFFGFLENFFTDESSKRDNGEPLPGTWQVKREDTRVYRPGVNVDNGRAMLVDVYTKEEYQWDFVTEKVLERKQG